MRKLKRESIHDAYAQCVRKQQISLWKIPLIGIQFKNDVSMLRNSYFSAFQ